MSIFKEHKTVADRSASDRRRHKQKIEKAIREGIHHIAFGVDDANNEISRLLGEGFEMIHQIAKAGADNKMIAFAHPKSTNGVLTEVCSDKDQAS